MTGSPRGRLHRKVIREFGGDRAVVNVSFGELVNSGATALPTSKAIAPAKEISFAEIVCPMGGPIEESDFARHFCTKQVLHIAQDSRRRFDHLLTWETINALLTMNTLDEGRIRITRDGRDVPTTLYRTNDGCIGLVNARKFHDLVKQNASVGINSIQFLSPPILRLANQIEIATGHKVWVNCYMTFGSGGAFAMHFDAHDVLVLQLYGTKRWFLYEEPEPAPLEHTPKVKPAPPREVAFETDLETGDVLFIPRGTYHRAAVTDTDSVHLTFGIEAFKRLKFIDGIRRVAENHRFFREDVPLMGGAEAFAEQERTLKEQLCDLINRSSLVEFVEQWQLKREPIYRFHIGPKPELDDDTLLAPLLRSPQAWRDSQKKAGKEFPPEGEAILQSLLEKNSATVGELKAELADVLDEDRMESTLAELLDDCWIEVVRD